MSWEAWGDGDDGQDYDHLIEVGWLPPEEAEELQADFKEAMKALEDLSFGCFAGIGIRPPAIEVYNRTFSVLERLRLKHNEGKPYGGPSGTVNGRSAEGSR